MWKEMRSYWKKACLVMILGAAYSLWLWRDADMERTLLLSNVLAVIAMLFFLVALAGVLHNLHALAAFSYGLRYVAHIFRNFRDRDELTGERMISYADYIQTYKRWKSVPLSFSLFGIFLLLSLAVWFLF